MVARIWDFINSILCFFLGHEYKFSEHLKMSDKFKCTHCNRSSYKSLEMDMDE